MSVLDRALFLGRILTIGLRRVAVGALNVESQCSWAAVPVFVMALTMSSRSFVAAKMHVKVSIGSCATLWENAVTVGLRSRGGALYVESQCSSAVVQNCFSPWRFHRCSSWVVASCPLFCSTADSRGDSTGAVPGRGCLHARCVQTVLGYDSAKLWNFRSCSAVMVVDVPVYAVHRWLWMSLCFCRDSGALAGGASDSVHRRSWWTFQLQRRGFFEG